MLKARNVISICTARYGRYVLVRQVTGTRTARYQAVPPKSTVGGRLREKSTVGGRLREKKKEEEEEKKKEEEEEKKKEVPPFPALFSPTWKVLIAIVLLTALVFSLIFLLVLLLFHR
ncbi:hypothetical protein BHE74_00007465 [Ensete ventricosum]|nr:hypothetical protein GW17_00032063 [Ensete ventricosum]RWW83980.1 hypothetical protein BHE74_00007465 [Ensete ventricosum]RZS14090.1 hypothetical protein BHM03_00045750 [Ensete ventricosum]